MPEVTPFTTLEAANAAWAKLSAWLTTEKVVAKGYRDPREAYQQTYEEYAFERALAKLDELEGAGK